MLRLRSCRVWSSVSLALFLSLLNTLVILVYLGPQHYRHESQEVFHNSIVPVVNHNMAPGMGFVHENPNPAQVGPQDDKETVSLVHQRSPNSSYPTAMVSDWHSRLPVATDEHENLDHAHKQLKLDLKAMSMVGKPPRKPVEIVIGIPTVKRFTSDYLSSTLRQLVDNLSHSERKQCHIVVFSADFDPAVNKRTADFVADNFKREIESGLIEVIRPDKAFYPSFKDLPVLWKDKPDRIQWRSKQCVDYALLFAYCRTLGRYYLQLEDDVTVEPQYFSQMKFFINARGSSKWSNLQFGTRGFIGMLFKSIDLGRLALFVKMYFWIFPVDILFRQFNDVHLYGNSPQDIYSPPLFRHVGVESSLRGQTRKLEDVARGNKKFVNVRKYKDAGNPQGLVTTSIQIFGSYAVDGPYRTANLGYFWGKDVKVSDYIAIEFTKPLTLLRVMFETGSQFAPEDTIGEGQLETAGISKDGGCDVKAYTVLKSTRTDGRIEASSDKFGGIGGVKCVRLVITQLNRDKNGKPRWLVLREVAVWSQ